MEIFAEKRDFIFSFSVRKSWVPFYEKAGFDRFAAGMRFCEYRRMMGVER